MCRRCLFSRQSGGVLSPMAQSGGLDRNEFQQRAQELCRHDKKRITKLLQHRNNPDQNIVAVLPQSRQLRREQVPYLDLLQQYGQQFTAPDFARSIVFHDFSLGNCYGMACLYAHLEKDALYVEGVGYGFEHPYPIPHAWNLTPDNEVIDYSWPMSHWSQYFGIVFDLDWVKENCVMECGIFYPEYWPDNEAKVREYLSLRQ